MKHKPKKHKKAKAKSSNISTSAPEKPLSQLEIIFCLVAWVPISGVCAYFVGGFVGGFVLADAGYSILGNTIGRVFIGCVMCILSVVNGGLPPEDFRPAKPLNFWPYIFGSWAAIFGVPFVSGIYQSCVSKQQPKQAVHTAMLLTAQWVRGTFHWRN